MGQRGKASAGMAAWIDQELAGCMFADVRLEKRFKLLVERLSEAFPASQLAGSYRRALHRIGGQTMNKTAITSQGNGYHFQIKRGFAAGAFQPVMGRVPRSPGARSPCRARETEIPSLVPHQSRAPRRLSCPSQ